MLIALDLIIQLLEICPKETFQGKKKACVEMSLPVSICLIKCRNQSEVVISRKWISTFGFLNSVQHYMPGAGYQVHWYTPGVLSIQKTEARRLPEPKSSKQAWGTRATGSWVGGRRWTETRTMTSNLRGRGRRIRCSRCSLPTEWVLGQCGLHETPAQNYKNSVCLCV